MATFRRIKWHCEDCATDFYTWNDEEPVCAICKAASILRLAHAMPQASDVASPAILSENTRSVTSIAEGAMKDMGMTNMKDNVRAGETYAPAMTHDQIRMRDRMNGFWQQSRGMGARGMIPDGHAGVDKGRAMQIMQNTAKRNEGLG